MSVEEEGRSLSSIEGNWSSHLFFENVIIRDFFDRE